MLQWNKLGFQQHYIFNSDTSISEKNIQLPKLATTYEMLQSFLCRKHTMSPWLKAESDCIRRETRNIGRWRQNADRVGVPDLSRVILPFPHNLWLVKRAKSPLKASQWSSKALKLANKHINHCGHTAGLKSLCWAGREKEKLWCSTGLGDKPKQEEKSWRQRFIKASGPQIL